MSFESNLGNIAMKKARIAVDIGGCFTMWLESGLTLQQLRIKVTVNLVQGDCSLLSLIGRSRNPN